MDAVSPADDTPGYLLLRFALPANESFSGSFRVGFPSGMSLDAENTAPADRHELSSTPISADTWLIEIRPETTTLSAQADAAQVLARIAWTTDPSLPYGLYEIKISRLDFTLSDGSEIREDEIRVQVYTGPNGNAPVDAPEEIFYHNGILSVRTSVSESVTVYSLNGAPLFRSEKDAGQAAFRLHHLPKGLYIVHGSSGWARKIVVRK